MKRIKKITAGLLVIALAIVFANEDMIGSYAITHKVDTFEEGNIYKTGDVIQVLNPTYTILVDPGDESAGTDTFYYTYRTFFKDKEGYDVDVVYDNYSDSYSSSENGYRMLMPQVEEYNEETEEYEVNDAYWIIENVFFDDYYYDYAISFRQIDYTPPTAKIECDAKEIGPNDSAECKLTVEYVERLNKLDFEIDSDLFEISEEVGLNNWKVNKDALSGNKYSLVYDYDENNIEGVRNNNSRILRASLLGTTRNNARVSLLANTMTKDVFKFNVSTLSDAPLTSLVGNIKVQEIQYIDEKGNGTVEPQIATLNVTRNNSEEKKENETKKEEKTEQKKESVKEEKKAEEKNPVTGDNVAIYIVMLLLSVSGVVYTIKYKKKMNN